LLYLGFLVLEGILSDELFQHFMLLFVAIRILVSPHLATLHCDYAGSLLCKFVRDAEALYSKEILVYNVHNLLHLADDVKRLGCLDDFSAFPFENKLGHLKKLVKKPQFPLQQVVRGINEMQQQQFSSCDMSDKPAVSSEHTDGPLIASFRNAAQYRKLKTKKWMLSAGENNNCVLLDGDVPAVVKNILSTASGITLLCQKFSCISDVFSHPLKSSALNIYRVSEEDELLFPVQLRDILCKCMLIPRTSEDSFVVIPLLH